MKRICKELEKTGKQTWFDENNMEDRVDVSIMQRIENAKCAVAFITKRYCKHVDDLNTNCSKELQWIMDSKDLALDQVIPVILDEAMTDSRSSGKRLKFHLLRFQICS